MSGVSGMRTLEVFSRPGCHLCEQLLEELLPLVRDRLAIVVNDVATDDAWEQAYGIDIPVVLFEGREVCRHRLDREALNALLASI